MSAWFALRPANDMHNFILFFCTARSLSLLDVNNLLSIITFPFCLDKYLWEKIKSYELFLQVIGLTTTTNHNNESKNVNICVIVIMNEMEEKKIQFLQFFIPRFETA